VRDQNDEWSVVAGITKVSAVFQSCASPDGRPFVRVSVTVVEMDQQTTIDEAMCEVSMTVTGGE